MELGSTLTPLTQGEMDAIIGMLLEPGTIPCVHHMENHRCTMRW